MNPVRLEFLKAINENPRDRDTQLIFADWLTTYRRRLCPT